ncbi:MAG TPA: allantoicase [Streptosporangiaceae bacterium]|jgi:allantoicase
MTAGGAQAKDFRTLPDLASRSLGGSVVYANDELFAEKENLIKPGPAAFDPASYGPKGKVYDGWETRRRRDSGHDHATVRLGAPGVVHAVVVDTAHFRGNYPPQVSVEAARADGYPSPAELAGLAWHPLVPKSGAAGDTANVYPVSDRRRWSHVRLSIYPDGGVARLRVLGEVMADPAFLTGTVDLAALENGAEVTGWSDAFFSPPPNLIMPGRAAGMSDGWENARRRGPGNDYVVIRLAGAGIIKHVEVDTSCFVGNAPGWVRLSAADGQQQPGEDGGEELRWREVLAETRVQPDTRHRFLLAEPRPASHVRLDVIPDGGLARLRVHGELTDGALAALNQRWQQTAG